MRMNKERKTSAMNIVAMLLVEDLAEEMNKAIEEALLDFMQSKTASMLYNDSLKLWWD